MPSRREVNTPQEKHEIITYLKEGMYPDGMNTTQKRAFRQKNKHFHLEKEMLHYQTPTGYKIYLCAFEKTIKESIIIDAHNIGHLRPKKLFPKLMKSYYGINRKEVAEVVGGCHQCEHSAPLTHTVGPLRVITTKAPRERYQLDMVDLKSIKQYNKGYKFLLNIIDTYSKFLWSFPCMNKSSLIVVDCLEQVFRISGPCILLHSDNGGEFINAPMKELCHKWNVKHITGRPRNPKCQGQVERVNQTIKKYLSRAVVLQKNKNWVDILQKVVHEYNTSIHEATNHSPCKMFLGCEGFITPLKYRDIPHAYDDDMINGVVDDNRSQSAYQRTVDCVNNEESEVYINEFPFDEFDLKSDDAPPGTEVDENIYVPGGFLTPEEEERFHAHRETYNNRLIRNANKNNFNQLLAVGTKVLLKKDFSIDPKYKRGEFEGFYEQDSFQVVKLYDGTALKLENLKTKETIKVDINRVKRLSKQY